MKFTPKFDIGYGLHVPDGFDRLVDRNGEFNIIHTKRPIQFRDIYHYLINTTWTKFLIWVLLGYLFISGLFAIMYFMIGIDQLYGIEIGSFIDNLLQCFYFSTQTFSTVGYGYIAPKGHLASMTSSIEALIGLLFFSFGTGLLYGRFSRAKPNLKFSEHIYHRDLRGQKVLMFRVMHKHPNVLMDMGAEVYLMQKFKSETGGQELKYSPLILERNQLSIMPLTWTIVIIIDETNPLFNWTSKDFEANKGEFIVMIKYFDETFSQMIYQRYSYLYDELIFDKNFAPAHKYNERGTAILDHERLDEII